MEKIVKQNYAWTAEDERMLNDYINFCTSSDISYSSVGSMCTFIPYTKNIGVKLYGSANSRNKAMMNQMVAHNG